MQKLVFMITTLGLLAACEGDKPSQNRALSKAPAAPSAPAPESSAVPLTKVASPAPTPAKRLQGISGSFIQYQSWMKDLTPAQWEQELGAMKAAGVDTLVLQWMQNDNERFFSYHPWDDGGAYSWDGDVTEQILNYADRNGMKVMIGLAFNKGWWTKWNDRPFLEETTRNNVAFMSYLWLRYAHHHSMRGWYIPFEIMDSDYGSEAMGNLRGLLTNIARAGHVLFTGRKMTVAFSVYFQAHFTPERTTEIFTNLLRGSEIDLFMVQDGVGANEWQSELVAGGKVESYVKAFRQAGKNTGVPVWTILESFQKKAPGVNEFVPASLEQLRAQLAVEAPVSQKIITFDFFHYLSPYRGDAQKQLYEELFPQASAAR